MSKQKDLTAVMSRRIGRSREMRFSTRTVDFPSIDTSPFMAGSNAAPCPIAANVSETATAIAYFSLYVICQPPVRSRQQYSTRAHPRIVLRQNW